MPARDANNATWYVLRYEEDFLGPGDPNAPFAAESRPWLEDTAFYDAARHVLELLPEPLDPRRAVRPPPGLAVDVTGDIYRVDPRTGALRIVRCDSSDEPFPCEPQVLARPAGIAIDARGFVLVADPAARRVVALHHEDGSVQLVLAAGMTEPIDIAVGLDGSYFVADRAAGRIEVFSSRGVHLGGFDARNAAGLPATPSPIAVMIDSDGTLLVADSSHPRLLRFGTGACDPRLGSAEQVCTPTAAIGEPLDDAQLTTLTAALAGGDVALDALARAYGTRAPRFLGGACCPLAPNAGIVRLAGVHRAIRLLSLALGRRFEASGVFISRALDSGIPATTWHRIALDADLPPGTSIVVETATSDDPTPIAVTWSVPRDADGAPIPFVAAAPPLRLPGGAMSPPGAPVTDQLIQSPPGRFLWLRATLRSDGTATPSLRAVRATYPRVSYLELLPGVFRRDPDAGLFAERFLALFERVFTGIEDSYVELTRQLDPAAAPREVIDWLAALIDLAFDPSWSLAKRRALVGEAMELYALRGTPRGIARYVEIYTGMRPVVIEGFLERPSCPAFLGGAAAILGCGMPLVECRSLGTPHDALYAAYAHRFRVYAYLDDPCDEQVVLPVIERIVEVNKPAHAVHEVCVVYPGAQLGITASVGIGLVVGGAGSPATRLGGCDAPLAGDVAGVLGGDTVLGDRRSAHARSTPGVK
jgi:phage tail-like protein